MLSGKRVRSWAKWSRESRAAPGSRWVHISQHRNDLDSGNMLVWGDVYIDQQFKGIAGRIADQLGVFANCLTPADRGGRDLVA